MRFIKKFSQKHYKVYLDTIGKYVDPYPSINEWVKSFSEKELDIWIGVVNLFEKDDEKEYEEYYEEYSIMLTILIKYFIIELDIEEDSITLKNSQLKKLVLNFKYILYREYSNRNEIMEYMNEEYVLLK